MMLQMKQEISHCIRGLSGAMRVSNERALNKAKAHQIVMINFRYANDRNTRQIPACCMLRSRLSNPQSIGHVIFDVTDEFSAKLTLIQKSSLMLIDSLPAEQGLKIHLVNCNSSCHDSAVESHR